MFNWDKKVATWVGVKSLLMVEGELVRKGESCCRCLRGSSSLRLALWLIRLFPWLL